MELFAHNCHGPFLLHLIFFFLSSTYSAYLDELPLCVGREIRSTDTEKNGTISSSNYPNCYNNRTHCRYDFIGTTKERVKIEFTDFNLYHPQYPPHSYAQSGRKGQYGPNQQENDCSGEVDVLSAFVYHEDGTLGRIDDYCGSMSPLAIMSSGNRLRLEFKAPNSNHLVRGFSGAYSFVTDLGIKTGEQSTLKPCEFIYNSSKSTDGTITSPNHPGLYPRNTDCHYLFYGKDDEHVELHFTYFHIDGVQPCDDDTYSDYVELSNYVPVDRKYDRKCGTNDGLKVKSDRKFFRVTFKSNDRYDATGFKASYHFSNKTNHLTIRNTRSGCSYNRDEKFLFMSMILTRFVCFWIFH